MRLLFVALVAFTAWGASAQTIPAPVDTDFQSDVCAQCHMLVTSKSYAAQIVGPEKPLFFDDIGCLVQYERQGKVAPQAVQARYVRTVSGTGWVAVDKAVWVRTKDVRTPMGYGFHAFADQKSAQAFMAAHPQAQGTTWAEVQAAVPAMGTM